MFLPTVRPLPDESIGLRGCPKIMYRAGPENERAPGAPAPRPRIQPGATAWRPQNEVHSMRASISLLTPELTSDPLGLRYRPIPHRTVLVYEPAAARQPSQ